MNTDMRVQWECIGVDLLFRQCLTVFRKGGQSGGMNSTDTLKGQHIRDIVFGMCVCSALAVSCGTIKYV